MKRDPKPVQYFKPMPVVPLTGRVQFTPEQLKRSEAEVNGKTPF